MRRRAGKHLTRVVCLAGKLKGRGEEERSRRGDLHRRGREGTSLEGVGTAGEKLENE